MFSFFKKNKDKGSKKQDSLKQKQPNGQLAKSNEDVNNNNNNNNNNNDNSDENWATTEDDSALRQDEIGESLILDSQLVSAETESGSEYSYHMEHLKCEACQQDIAGQNYVQHDNQPFCIPCYEQNFSNICHECQRPIGVDFKDVSYKERHFHEQCFFCSQCKTSLVGVAFGSRDDKIYCNDCFDAAFGVKCTFCQNILKPGDRKLDYKGQPYHEQCFRCSKCEVPIGTKSFLCKDGAIYCSPCYKERFAKRCIKCCEVIIDAGIIYKGEPWHRDCFLCGKCSTKLCEIEFLSRDGQAYCRPCYAELFAQRCAACNKPIMGTSGAEKTRYISLESKHYHIACFKCTKCGHLLEETGFIRDGENTFCVDCVRDLMAQENKDVDFTIED